MGNRISALVVLFVIAACGPINPTHGVGLDVPANIRDRPRILDALTAGLNQLGIAISYSASDRVSVVEIDCSSNILGDVNWKAPREIKLCPAAFLEIHALSWTIKHELAHVLGMYTHTDCFVAGVTSPSIDCWFREDGVPYHAIDLDAIHNAILSR